MPIKPMSPRPGHSWPIITPRPRKGMEWITALFGPLVTPKWYAATPATPTTTTKMARIASSRRKVFRFIDPNLSQCREIITAVTEPGLNGSGRPARRPLDSARGIAMVNHSCIFPAG